MESVCVCVCVRVCEDGWLVVSSVCGVSGSFNLRKQILCFRFHNFALHTFDEKVKLISLCLQKQCVYVCVRVCV